MNLKKGTNVHIIYNALLFHEFMKKSTIIRKTGIPGPTLSGCLTKLRRCGLVEYSGALRGHAGSDISWKKHPIDKPLYPAQPDLVKRKNSKTETPEVTAAMRISHINTLITELATEMNALRALCEKSPVSKEVFVDSGIQMDGEVLFIKKTAE